MLEAGKGTAFLEIASGEMGTFVLIARSHGEPITVKGTQLVASLDDKGNGFLQLDQTEKAINGRVFDPRIPHPPIVVGSSDTLVGVYSVSLGANGAIATFRAGTTTPVEGKVLALTRTSSGAVWVAGSRWGSDDAFSEGKCDRKAFLGRRNKNGAVEVVACDASWMWMELAAVGEDVVLCASQLLNDVEIAGTKLKAQTFLARIGGDGTARWVRAINELGYTSCDDVVVTSDGDIVAVGAAAENADFTEGAVAKGIKEKPGDGYSGGNVGSQLWLARYSGDGTRRWSRRIGETLLGSHASLAADRNGNAVLAAVITDPIDLGHGPVGPDGAVMAATIDRDAKVHGMLVAEGGASGPRVAMDAANGLLFGFSTSDPVRVAGITIKPPGKTPIAAVVRVPLPLPAP